MLNQNKQIGILFISIIILHFMFGFSSCREKPNFETSENFELSFSCDTLKFDTLFSTLASPTKSLMLKNTSSKWIKIDQIYLANGMASFFRINVNGDSSSVVKDVEIAPKDSIFIFVNANIYSGSNAPLLIEEHIVFRFNTKEQKFLVQAWGQDAYFHKPTHALPVLYPNPIDPSKIDTQYIHYSLVDCSKPLPSDKPHIIFGYWVVDSEQTLRIPAGTKLHFAQDGGLWVYEGASLKVNGARGNPVVFDGIRQDGRYKEIPGQWLRIWLSAGSKDNEIDYALIKNASVGIWCDTVANMNPNLKISNTIIRNMSSDGILAQGSSIYAYNVVISNCQNACLNISMGGEHEYYHCTFANFWKSSTKTPGSIILNDYYKDYNNATQYRPITKANFTNCIIYGNNETQILFDLEKNGKPSYLFSHCLIKQKEALKAENVLNCKYNSEPLFNSIDNQNYAISSDKSPALYAGNSEGSIVARYDINGVPRSSTPTLGAYEYVSKPNPK